MKYIISFTLSILSAGLCYAQSYKDSMQKYRYAYIMDFLSNPKSPLKAEDTGYLRFYVADVRYRVPAVITLTPDTKAQAIPTHSGKTKLFRDYGLLSFSLMGKKLSLHAYINADSTKPKSFQDYLFIPFNDKTNYTETYGGGRYLEFAVKDIKDNKVLLDFNKCYNPYCAYAGGYSCPIPPEVNHLKVPVKAGEKLFAKKHEE